MSSVTCWEAIIECLPYRLCASRDHSLVSAKVQDQNYGRWGKLNPPKMALNLTEGEGDLLLRRILWYNWDHIRALVVQTRGEQKILQCSDGSDCCPGRCDTNVENAPDQVDNFQTRFGLGCFSTHRAMLSNITITQTAQRAMRPSSYFEAGGRRYRVKQ